MQAQMFEITLPHNCTARAIANGTGKFEIKLRIGPTGDWKKIGDLDTVIGTFTTYRKNKLVFRKLNAWGLNPDVLRVLPDLKTIVVENDESQTRYTTTVETFFAKCILGQFSTAGYEPQAFLPLGHWQQQRM